MDRIRKFLRDIPASMFLIIGLALTFFLLLNGLSIISALDYEKDMENKKEYSFNANICVNVPFAEGENVDGSIYRDEDFDAEAKFNEIINISKTYKGNCYMVADLEGENEAMYAGDVYLTLNEEKVYELKDGSYKTVGGAADVVKGVYIYEGMGSVVHNIDGKDKVMIHNEYYEVEGMIKDYTMEKNIEGISLNWDSISTYCKEGIEKYQKRWIREGNGVQIIFESNLPSAKEDFDEICNKYIDAGYELLDVEEYFKNAGEDEESIFDEASFVLTLVLTGFAVINCMYI